METTPSIELVEAATLVATEMAAEVPLTVAPVEATTLTSFLRMLCKTACQKILSTRTALAAMVAVMLAAVATALPAKAPTTTPADTVSATPDKCRLMASQILADSTGERKLIDRPQILQKYMESGRTVLPQRWKNVQKVEALMELTTQDGRIHKLCQSEKLLTLSAPELSLL